MKKLVLTCAVFFASAGVAFAADPIVTPGPFDAPPAFPPVRTQEAPVTPGTYKAPPPFGAIRLFDWTGFYLGVNGGGALTSTSWTSVPDLVSGTLKSTGGLIGGTAGYNLQTGDAFVEGVEADMDWTSISGTVSPASCPSCNFRIPWLATTRLRFGYSINGFLPYATGGAAIGGLYANQSGAPFGTATSANLGWTAGGGLEVAITDALRVKIEYLYVNLNGFSCNGPCSLIGTGGGPISFNPTGSIIRVGLNYKLWN
jgi:outer membrane immunogenic protein